MDEQKSIWLRGGKLRVGSKRLIWALALGMAAAALGLARPQGALAGNTPPIFRPEGVYFTGNQSQAINSNTAKSLNIWNLNDGRKNIVSENLTKDIPASAGPGIIVEKKGAPGEDGGDSKSSGFPWTWHGARSGDNGADGGYIYLKYRGNQASISLLSEGGRGGSGGDASVFWSTGGNGAKGGAGGTVQLENRNANISAQGFEAIMAKSAGGSGGNGGYGASATGQGGSGGNGGGGSSVWVMTLGSSINTTGDKAQGIVAASAGGNGGNGNWGGGMEGKGGRGGNGGNGGNVQVLLRDLRISTSGNFSSGVRAVSQGGSGGNGGEGRGISGKGGAGGIGGAGGKVEVLADYRSTTIKTLGEQSYGILAQSMGGMGGNGGAGKGIAGKGGGAAGPGLGGIVQVLWNGNIETSGKGAGGILAQSVGGFGGSGGSGSGLVGFGAGGESGGSGGTVEVTLRSGSVKTQGGYADAICAQSIGGGGGNGGGGGGIVSLGGSGNAGGNGGNVTVDNNVGTLTTSGDFSRGILAQSIGGGGGNGGSAISGGLSFSAALGGKGGAGGNGSQVIVWNHGAISTGGKESATICAQSIGGGGGSGGYAVSASAGKYNVNFAMGGSGGSGGSGGYVEADNVAALTTQGQNSYGIQAQSLGGGGGDGGFTITANAGSNFNGAFGMGGSGGTGGNGGEVKVFNSGRIETHGDNACGILAESVGGGGGAGGGSISGSLGQGSANFSFGGGGGNGGNGGKVTATVNGSGQIGADISTTGKLAAGLLAQSVGGGGGNGGYSITGSVGQYNLGFSMGGSGGSGGSGGEVTAASSANIFTSGERSDGILAQSLGGGGGNGGLSIAAAVGGGDSKSFNATASVGGSGGNGGTGGAVNLTSTGGIITLGDYAAGLKAQSVGGGGGSGGLSISGNLNLTRSINAGFSLGGAGGGGGTGGQVTLNANSGLIITGGAQAAGIFAQSVGGGGGSGGLSVTGIISGGATGMKLNANLSYSMGGKGGAGNKGGTVDVANKAEIITLGADSYGIFAQSVGGGGGCGGSSYTGTLSPKAGAGDTNLSLGASVGGNGGSGNTGGTVTVNNEGNIATLGAGAHGILAQSIGGGGGTGGDSNMMNIFVPTGAGAKNNFKADVKVGGNGGVGCNGGNVSVTNKGSINTFGDLAYGIFAQSIGGGGGNAANSMLSSIPDPQLINLKSMSVVVGGSGGASGNGGAVTVDNSGAITTAGKGSYGILAQSLGGGGGIGGNANIGSDFKIGLGGSGGAAGNGGQITVDNRANISTQGNDAHGIFAQSVGGGGGIAGNVARGVAFPVVKYQLPHTQYFGVGVGFGGKGGGGGAGGTVNVTSTGNITTQGTGAHGIFAQSVGGAGGLGGIDTGYPGRFIFNGSVWGGGAGAGGQVSVSETGTITTQGDGAHGIVAQSTAGNDKAGKVDVTLTGNIYANGNGANGIQAQSLGAKGSGDISVTINAGSTVQGGKDTASATSYGVLFMDGANNVLTNRGSIATAGGVNGTAVMQQGDYGAASRGNLSINNYGTITGSINQGDQAASALNQGLSLAAGTSTINFNNNGGTFNTGRIINLGGGILANRGYLYVGGGTALQSNLTGNFFQDHTGYFQTMLNSDGTGGSLKVSGSTQLDGTLQVFKSTGIFLNGKTYDILTSSQNITTRFSRELLPTPTALVSFTTNYLANSVQVISHVRGLSTVADSALESALAQFDDSLLSNASGDLLRIIEEIQSLQLGDFNNVFNSLSPNVYDANTITTFNITRQYLRTLQRRLQNVRQNPALQETALSSKPVLLAFNGSNKQLRQFLSDGQDAALQRKIGVWLEGFHQWGNQGGADGFSGFSFGSTGTAAGLDYALTERVTLGANFGYSYTSMNLDNDFGAGRINSLYGSLYGTAFGERSYLGGVPYLEGILCYGHHDYKNNRLISIGTIQRGANSTHQGNSFSVFTEGGYAVPVKKWSVQPFASLLFTHLAEGSVQETGADSLNMQIDARQTNSVVSELGLRAARPIKTSKGTLIPEVKAAWQHDFAVDKRTIPLSFAGLPTGLTIDGQKLTQDSATVSAALSFTSTGGITTTLKYDGEFRSGYKSHGVLGEVRLSF